MTDEQQPAPAEPEQPAREPAPRTHERRRPGGDGLAALVGGGGSQVGVNGAMRARDVSRPR
jgi:hypothetical protein